MTLPFDTSLGLLALLLLGLLALLGIVVHWKAPFWGFALLLIMATAMPLQVGPGGLNGCVLLAGALCCAWIVTMVARRWRLETASVRVVVPTLAFMGVVLLSFLLGQYPWFPVEPAPMRAQVGGLALFFLSAGLFLAVGYQVRSLDELRVLTMLFIGIGGMLVSAQVFAPPALELALHAISVPDSIGSMFWTWLVAMSVSQALCNRDLTWKVRAVILAVGVLALARGLLLAFSWVSGWLPPLVAVGVIVLMRFPRTTVSAAAVAAAPALFVSTAAINKLMAGESYSWLTRLEAMSVIVQMLRHDPWFGFGPANYYHYTLLFPILGWWVRFNSHNNYLDILAQTGVVGLGLFGWVMFEVGRLALRLRSRAPGGFASAYAVGALGGLIGSAVAGAFADWIVPFVYNIGLAGFRSSLLFWFFLGGVLAIERVTDRATLSRRVSSFHRNSRAGSWRA